MRDLEKRINPDIQVPEEIYITGLIDVSSFLFSELEVFLEDEGRYFGITKSYIHSINQALGKIYSDTTEEDADIYEKILFLYKPILLREFKRLTGKRLSPGDAVIVIVKKILEICSSHEGYKHGKELRTMKKIITKFFDNIKNNRKKDSLYLLSSVIKTYMEAGVIGKFNLSQLDLKELDAPKVIMTGSGIRMDEESENKVGEIVWTGE